MMHNGKWILKRLTVLTVLTVVFLFAGLYNHYPLVTSDTGSYINHAFDFQFPADRSPFYGVFVGISSLWKSLWLTTIAQSFCLAFVFSQYCKLFLGKEGKPGHILLVGLMVVICTCVIWMSSEIMPDIFTGILLLSTLLYLFDTTASRFLRVVYICIIFGAVIVHNSHFLIFLLFTLVLVAISYQKYKLLLRKALLLFILSVSSWVFICGLHYFKGYGLTPSQGTHVFMMGKLAETGILEEYLAEHCAENRLQLCAYRSEIPKHAIEFLWLPESPLYKTGGWDSSKREYNAIIKDVFTTPHYLLMFAGKSLTFSLRQLAEIQIARQLTPFDSNSSPRKSISRYYPGELKSFELSKQNKSEMNMSVWRVVHLFFFIFSSIAVIFIFLKKREHGHLLTYLLICVFIIINAFVTATFANVLDRLQYRVFWVLPATNAIILIKHYILLYRGKAAEKAIF